MRARRAAPWDQSGVGVVGSSRVESLGSGGISRNPAPRTERPCSPKALYRVRGSPADAFDAFLGSKMALPIGYTIPCRRSARRHGGSLDAGGPRFFKKVCNCEPLHTFRGRARLGSPHTETV
jgi:hypothetical protein